MSAKVEHRHWIWATTANLLSHPPNIGMQTECDFFNRNKLVGGRDVGQGNNCGSGSILSYSHSATFSRLTLWSEFPDLFNAIGLLRNASRKVFGVLCPASLPRLS